MTNSHHPRRRPALAFLALSIPIVSDICAEEPSIEMRLDWPTERNALVEAVKTWEIKGARQPESTMRVKYTSRVLKVPDGYEAEIGDVDFTMDGKNANDEEATAIMQGLLLFGRVDNRGKFLEFFDFDHLQEMVRSAYREKFKEKTFTSDGERILARATSRQLLQSEAASTWNALLGLWVGSNFRVGVPQNKSQAVYLPAFDQSYRLDGRAVISNYEKCSPTDSAATCVRLKFSATPDPATLRAAIQHGLESFGQNIGDLEPAAPDSHLELEILTDPHTLTPYWAKWSQEATITAKGDSGSATTVRTVTTTFTFQYR